MPSTGPWEPIEFGRYRLEERLAIGGMAEIFRATSFGAHGFEKTLVIKRILPALSADPEFVKMFIDEARVMTQLNHPKVVQVHDFGEIGGQYYIVMEYVEGLDLLDLLRTCARRQVRPTTAIAVHIVAEVLDALEFAHTLKSADGTPLGIVHSDVSPSNVFISALGEVKLGDFGIARAQADGSKSGVEPGTLRGKYGYMSPEQVSGRWVDARSDIFASGIVLAELLMIRRLFIAKNDLEVLLQVRDARLERLHKFGRRIPPDLMEILESALARDPGLRYQAAGAFRDALHRYLFENRRMVRSTDVRRFLARLRDSQTIDRLDSEADHAKAGPKDRARPPVAARLSDQGSRSASAELEDESVTPPIVPEPTLEAPSRLQAALLAKARSRVSSVNSLDGGSAPADTMPSLRETLVSEDVVYRDTDSAPDEKPSVVGKKRRIQLSPPPAPAPVPQGLPHTGEEPRLSTRQALAAVPELSAGSSSNRDFRTPSHIDIAKRGGTSDSTDKPLHESELVVARRQTTPIARIPTLSEPDEEGILKERSLFRIVFSLAVSEDTGLLILRRGDAVKEIYLVDGHPHYVSSNQAEELFGQYLRKKNIISSGELSMALAMLPHFGGRLGDALVALKLMRPMHVLRHLTHQVREKVLEAFDWPDGEYFFYRDKQAQSASAPLGLEAYELLGAGVNRIDSETVESRLADYVGICVNTERPPPVPPEVFRLGKLPRQAYDKLDGTMTLGKLLSRFDDRSERRAFERVVYLFLETGLAH